MLPEALFKTVVANAPLVSVDLIVRNPEGAVLLGLRRNAPARGYWFVPGGRLYKGESVQVAQARISQQELGGTRGVKEASFLGVFEHHYRDNFLGNDPFGTHYVVLAYELQWSQSALSSPDSQHQALRWWEEGELLRDRQVHSYTQAYFQPSQLE